MMAALATELASLFSNLRADAIDKALGSDIPLVGTALETASAAFFTTLQDQITSALAGKTTAAEIAAALNGIAGSPVTATDNGDGTVSIEIKASDTQHVALANKDLDIGNDKIGLDLKTDLSTDIAASADLKLKFDTAGTGTLSLDPSNTKELNLHIGTDLSLTGDGNLGPLAIHVEDKGTTPEFNLDFAVDLNSLNPADPNAFKVTASGAVDLDLGVNTNIDPKLLPDIFTDLVFHWGFDGTSLTATAPTYRFDNV